jgi:hypothetical protein
MTVARQHALPAAYIEAAEAAAYLASVLVPPTHEEMEANLSAILLAEFDDHPVAEHVRVALVRNGFPTDRVELTATCEPGRAALGPADSPHDKFVQYFGLLFRREDQRHFAEQLAERVENGAAMITVHPRGAIETACALAILANAGALRIFSHDLPNQTTRVCRGQA